MVKLTQIEDESNGNTFPEAATASVPKEEEYLSTDDEEDWDDEFDEDETLLDRIVALKDIISPSQKDALSSLQQTLQSTTSSFFSKTGSFLWVLTSSTLLLGVPLALSILNEQQLLEMEKEMSLQQSSQELLAPGSDSAFQQPQPSPSA